MRFILYTQGIAGSQVRFGILFWNKMVLQVILKIVSTHGFGSIYRQRNAGRNRLNQSTVALLTLLCPFQELHVWPWCWQEDGQGIVSDP